MLRPVLDLAAAVLLVSKPQARALSRVNGVCVLGWGWGCSAEKCVRNA